MRRLLQLSLLALTGLLATSVPAAQAVPVLRVSAGDLVFNDVALGATRTQSVTVSNAGDGSMVIGAPSVLGGDAKDFAVPSTTCSGATLTAGASCSISVGFTPLVLSTRLSHLRVPANIVGCTVWVAVAGTGAAVTGPDHAEAHAGFSFACPGEVTALPGTTTVISVPGTSTTTTTTTSETSSGVLGESESGGSTVCKSVRRLRIHFKAPRGTKIDASTLTVRTKGRTFTAKRYKSGRRAGQYYSDLSFRGLKVGRYMVRVRAKLTNGKAFKRNRHFVTCISGKTPSN